MTACGSEVDPAQLSPVRPTLREICDDRGSESTYEEFGQHAALAAAIGTLRFSGHPAAIMSRASHAPGAGLGHDAEDRERRDVADDAAPPPAGVLAGRPPCAARGPVAGVPHRLVS